MTRPVRGDPPDWMLRLTRSELHLRALKAVGMVQVWLAFGDERLALESADEALQVIDALAYRARRDEEAAANARH